MLFKRGKGKNKKNKQNQNENEVIQHDYQDFLKDKVHVNQFDDPFWPKNYFLLL